ncbi:hypothetical protein GOODEAATRI_029686, partial [Goodea atripinnis]
EKESRQDDPLNKKRSKRSSTHLNTGLVPLDLRGGPGVFQWKCSLCGISHGQSVPHRSHLVLSGLVYRS